MTLTKSDIDALVEGMPKGGYNNEAVVLTRGGPDESLMATKDMCRLCYLAAGLTADGEAKPDEDRVRMWMVTDTNGVPPFVTLEESVAEAFEDEARWTVYPGWFVPDGAEGEG